MIKNMKSGTNITTKKVIGSLKKKSKSRDFQSRSMAKAIVRTVKKPKKIDLNTDHDYDF